MIAFLQLLAIFWGPYLLVGAWIAIKQLIERK
jgi:hypothetical protein